MGMRFFVSYLLLLVMLWATACSKGGSTGGDDGSGGGNGSPHVINAQDTIPPVVEINTPTASQVFSSGSTITITGKVTDGDGLYQGSIRITNDATGSVLKEQLYVIHGVTQYNFNITYGVTVTSAADYTVTVMFEDHGLNSTSKSVKVKATP
ncbi:MAG: hypothetical protein JNN00_11565 [Chitinophagaceae bacterium]|nr:hypothetical protein [Chitinophagaceae bacterium]